MKSGQTEWFLFVFPSRSDVWLLLLLFVFVSDYLLVIALVNQTT